MAAKPDFNASLGDFGNKSHYNVLQIPRSATSADIQKAFKQKAPLYHPDKTGEQNTVKFQRLVEARDTLLNQIARGRYDEEHDDDLDSDITGVLLSGEFSHLLQYIKID